MERYEEYIEYLKNNLSEKRFIHSLNVADMARKLAINVGEDEEKAYLAGLLHDVCKEMPYEKQEELVLASDRDVDEVEKLSKPVWHGIAAAEFLKTEFDINDEAVLSAIRYHTVAKGNMTALEKIVYLADLVSVDRTYSDVEDMRAYAFEDLNKGMKATLKFIVSFMAEKERMIPRLTIDAYNEYVKAN